MGAAFAPWALKGAPDPQAAAQAADPRTASVDGDLVARLKSIRADLAAALAA